MLDELRWTLRSLVIDALLMPEYRRSGVAFNPVSAKAIRNPYPAYARLRHRSPVHRSRVLDGWVFSRLPANHSRLNSEIGDFQFDSS